jgi:predicted kinase
VLPVSLIVFGGLPGTGKTTLARAIAGEMQAAYVRIDSIEQALRNAGLVQGDMGPGGYIVAYAVAAANLRIGCSVVADCVNPLSVSRDAWREVAKDAGADIVEIEIVCADATEHRRRIETRICDIAGLALPLWQDVMDQDYEPWDRPRCVVDTAGRGIGDSIAECRREIAARAQHGAAAGSTI